MLTTASVVDAEDSVDTITVNTLLRGEVEARPDQIVTFVEPLLGFEHLDRFLVYQTQDGPLYWLQALEDVNTSFCVLTPFATSLDPDYEIGKGDVSDLDASTADEITVYTMVTLSKDPGATTTNLRAPILVSKAGKAKQVIIDNDKLPIRYLLADLMRGPL